MAHQVSKDLMEHPAQMESKVIQDLKVFLDQLDRLVVMENLVVMAGMETEENKELLGHRDQE